MKKAILFRILTAFVFCILFQSDQSFAQKQTMKGYNSPTLAATTKFATLPGRKLAYRVIGTGEPIIFCNRFRGILDTWDPAFIDLLAKHYQVILFDYSGIGRSTDELPLKMGEVAEDVKDLANFLHLKNLFLEVGHTVDLWRRISLYVILK